MKKYVKYLYVTVCLALTLSFNAAAYLDPSVMTYTIQAVAGILVAVGAVAGICWRKAKKKVQNKLGIDENAKKEMEADIIEIEQDKKES